MGIYSPKFSSHTRVALNFFPSLSVLLQRHKENRLPKLFRPRTLFYEISMLSREEVIGYIPENYFYLSLL